MLLLIQRYIPFLEGEFRSGLWVGFCLPNSTIHRFTDLLICDYLRKSVVDDCIDYGIYAVCSTSSVGAISGRNYAPLHDLSIHRFRISQIPQSFPTPQRLNALTTQQSTTRFIDSPIPHSLPSPQQFLDNKRSIICFLFI